MLSSTRIVCLPKPRQSRGQRPSTGSDWPSLGGANTMPRIANEMTATVATEIATNTEAFLVNIANPESALGIRM